MAVTRVSPTRVMEFIKTPISERDKLFTPDEIKRFNHRAKIRAKRNLMELVWMSQGLNEKAIREVFAFEPLCKMITNISLSYDDVYDVFDYTDKTDILHIESRYLAKRPKRMRMKEEK